MSASIDDVQGEIDSLKLPPLPAPQIDGPRGEWTELNRSTFSPLPAAQNPTIRVTMNLTRAAWVEFKWSAIAGLGGGPTGAAIEFGPNITGSLNNAPTSFGNVARVRDLSGPESRERSRILRVPSGTVTAELFARTYNTTSGAGDGATLRSVYLSMTPLRWAA